MSHRPSRTALAARARTMIEAMTERERWVYALPPAEAARHLATVLGAAGFAVEHDPPSETGREGENDGSRAEKWAHPGGSFGFTALYRDDLDVTLVEAHGADAAATLGQLLERTGFFAQSTLLESAFSLEEEAKTALTTLAHMVVAWDDDWADLFLLHLASPDPIVRNDAVTAVCIAAMIARDPGPAPELLAEAAQRETFPKLRDTIDDARALVARIAARAD